jgi:hypothetical protein
MVMVAWSPDLAFRRVGGLAKLLSPFSASQWIANLGCGCPPSPAALHPLPRLTNAAMFAGTTTTEIVTSSFLLILGYFFGQATSRRSAENGTRPSPTNEDRIPDVSSGMCSKLAAKSRTI